MAVISPDFRQFLTKCLSVVNVHLEVYDHQFLISFLITHHSLDCEVYIPCKDLARSFHSRYSSEDPSISINSFKDPWRTKYSSQGSCEQIDSSQDLSRFIHSFSVPFKDLTWDLAFRRILEGIHILPRTLKVLFEDDGCIIFEAPSSFLEYPCKDFIFMNLLLITGYSTRQPEIHAPSFSPGYTTREYPETSRYPRSRWQCWRPSRASIAAEYLPKCGLLQTVDARC